MRRGHVVWKDVGSLPGVVTVRRGGRVEVDPASVLFSTFLGTVWEWGCRAEVGQPLLGVNWTSFYASGLQCNISLE